MSCDLFWVLWNWVTHGKNRNVKTTTTKTKKKQKKNQIFYLGVKRIHNQKVKLILSHHNQPISKDKEHAINNVRGG